jgi:SAM-dependent methyltransferase
MPKTDEFWDFYWEVRLQAIQDLGKRESILAVSKLIRELAEHTGSPLRLLELGCGEGQIIGSLLNAHPQDCSITGSVGVDQNSHSLEKCRRNYSNLQLVKGDFTDLQLLSNLGQFEIVLLVNALHEVFSAGYSQELGEVDIPASKQRVRQAFAGASERVAPGGYMVLFDGLEAPGDPQEQLRVRFLHPEALNLFHTFAREYYPFRVSYREVGDSYCVELSKRDFTRYITKSIFLGKQLWQSERLESYQYFNEDEFRAIFDSHGLIIQELRTLTVNYDKWSSAVAIETPGVNFPAEHILILAQNSVLGESVIPRY